jgi:long-chain fatty acid transport protein
MYRFAAATAALLASTGIAQADISRTDQSMRVLFEEVGPTGQYVELSFGSVRPTAGTANAAVPYNPLQDYTLPGFAYLSRINENLSFAVIYDTPFGADVGYRTGVPFLGGNASVDSDALTVVGRYEFGNGFSVHAGIRALEMSGSIFTSVRTGIFDQLNASSDTGIGYLVGAAYEIPEIALRVALTYHSSIDLDFTGTEQSSNVAGVGVLAAPGAVRSTAFAVEMPESLNLEFQTGIAENTLLFGSIRHQWWDGFNLTTPTGRYVNFTSDSTSYQLGIGRRFTENWSGSFSYQHRTSGTTPSDTALAPTTGFDTITLAGRYDRDNITVSAGVTYGFPGDQIVNTAAAPFGVGPISFDDNEILAVGLRIGFRF